MNLTIDSSVFISFFGKTDEYTPESKDFFRLIKNHEVHIILSSVIIAEVITILSQQKSKDVLSIFKGLIKFETIPLDEVFVTKYTNFINENPINFKTSDCIIAYSCRLSEGLLVTWDKQLISPKNKICQGLTPTDYLEKFRKD